MTKLKLVSWIILLLAFSGISGFLTVLIETPAAPLSPDGNCRNNQRNNSCWTFGLNSFFRTAEIGF
jgi:hypothetical protein